MRRALAILSALAMAGCTNIFQADLPPATPALRLVSYDSCEQLLPSLREATRDSVGAYGFGGGGMLYSLPAPTAARGEAAAGADAANKAAAPVQGEDYSGTNTHTEGVDEPDLVKTDGKRILVISHGWLRVIDAESKRITGGVAVDQAAHAMLLQGDRVLVLSQGYQGFMEPAIDDVKRMAAPANSTHVQLVNLSGQAKTAGDFTIEASLVDARQVGSLARVVVRSTPRIQFPTWGKGGNEGDQVRANQAAIDAAPVTSWLPKYIVNGKQGTVGCNDVSRPDYFSGTSVVTVLSFDLSKNDLSDGDPMSVMADGGTIYGSGPNLYLAHDKRFMANRAAMQKKPYEERTEIFAFDITSPKANYVASGSIPGSLLNQYSLSEHNGVLRAATTVGQKASAVYALRREGGTLTQIGEVGGLGKGERIYAVRFVGTVGYVVTFRQTDPLYTIDLRDPSKPKVMGELKIPGYSAYLHPVGADRLIGLGQDATDQGRITGTQISLFDVGNLADPRRVAQFKIPRAHSEAEYDPHAFLYWPQTKLLVVPLRNEALLLKVGDSELTELGRLTHQQGQIRRSLVIGQTLWTVSDQGLLATTLDGATKLSWLAL